MPAHFVTPQAPYSDPPGTAVTSGHSVAGRPAMSWAAALLACGIFVGVAAVAVSQGSDSVADTTASFVDPSRVPMRANANVQPPVAPMPLPVAPVAPVDPNAPQGLIGASPVPPSADQAGTPVAGAPIVAGFAPVAVKRAAPQWKAPAVAAPAAKPAAKASAAPPAAPAAGDDDAKEAKKESKKKKGGADSADDETKKALEALQKAQLESASSFGN
jgi:hypothetical protein